MYDCNDFPEWRNQARYCAQFLSAYKGNIKYQDILIHLYGFNWLPYQSIERLAAMILAYAKYGRPNTFYDVSEPDDEQNELDWS